MQFSPCNLESLEQQINQIRRASRGEIVTNYFKQPMSGETLLASSSSTTTVFVNKETDFFRVYFYSSNLSALSATLQQINLPGPAVIAYVAKAADSKLEEAFYGAGFRNYATYVRLTCQNLKVYSRSSHVQFATADDVEALQVDLRNFDKYTDYLPDKAVLLELISSRQVILNKKAGAICGYIIFRVIGSKVNFNYFFNRSDDPRDSLTLLQNFYAVLHERGIRSGFQWNNVSNIRVRRLHAQFGWKEDGLKVFFYLKCHNNLTR